MKGFVPQTAEFVRRVREAIRDTAIIVTNDFSSHLQASVRLKFGERDAILTCSHESKYLQTPPGLSGFIYSASFEQRYVDTFALQRTATLDPLLPTMRAWLVEGASALRLSALAEGVEVKEELVRAYEAGPRAYATYHWDVILRWLADPTERHNWANARLRPVVELASRHPMLREWRPFLAMFRMGIVAPFGVVSRLPVIIPKGDGLYVYVLVNFNTGEVFAEGSAADVVSGLAERAACATPEEAGLRSEMTAPALD